MIGDYLYEYKPKYFDIDRIVLEYDLDEENFSPMNAQHVIAVMVGFRKWTDLVKASDAELELAKLLFDNQHKIYIDDWQDYIAEAEDMNGISFDPEDRLEIFKQVFVDVDGSQSFRGLPPEQKNGLAGGETLRHAVGAAEFAATIFNRELRG